MKRAVRLGGSILFLGSVVAIFFLFRSTILDIFEQIRLTPGGALIFLALVAIIISVYITIKIRNTLSNVLLENENMLRTLRSEIAEENRIKLDETITRLEEEHSKEMEYAIQSMDKEYRRNLKKLKNWHYDLSKKMEENHDKHTSELLIEVKKLTAMARRDDYTNHTEKSEDS